MNKIINASVVLPLISIACLLCAVTTFLNAHCDTMNGPVVLAAKNALETGNVNLILIWVQKGDELLIKEAFNKTLAVRKLNNDAKKLADMYFFETVVRIHRAGEGVAYTGLKEAESDIEPGIEAADKALASGSAEQLLHHLSDAVQKNIAAQFSDVAKKKGFKSEDVAAGREYVKAYVRFIHYVERLHQAVSQPPEGHLHDGPAPSVHHEEH